MTRLDLAFQAGLERPDSAVFLQPDEFDFPISEPVVYLTSAAACQRVAGDVTVLNNLSDLPQSPLAVVRCTRSKSETRDLIARAVGVAAVVAVDGQKTDGIDSHLRAVKKKTDVTGQFSKSHGKLFWFSGGDFADWRAQPTMVSGFETRAGVFSENAIDPGSQALLAALPKSLKGRIADFGAGWGYLSRTILERGAAHLTLVEDNFTALSCAKKNVIADNVDFLWQDVTTHIGRYDSVIMNPPFHTGRKGDPDLGKAFIATAAKCLGRRGDLWMVANRHLPYETTLHTYFGQVDELAGTSKFKIFHAQRPKSKV